MEHLELRLNIIGFLGSKQFYFVFQIFQFCTELFKTLFFNLLFSRITAFVNIHRTPGSGISHSSSLCLYFYWKWYLRLVDYLNEWGYHRTWATQWTIADGLGLIPRGFRRHAITILILHGGDGILALVVHCGKMREDSINKGRETLDPRSLHKPIKKCDSSNQDRSD